MPAQLQSNPPKKGRPSSELAAVSNGIITSPQSNTPMPVAELTPQQERKIRSLEASISRLQCQITQTEKLLSEAQEKYKATHPANDPPPDPAFIVKRHIRLLHEYNEIKDIGQGLLGLIAEGRGVRCVDVQREYGIGGND
ncbi:DNA repair protein Swi5/Sae3 [Coccidioides immitis RS]|uniref:DNA repair protein Swi5/Sae3 n=6 Tax=Coccidioides TaxID=5500 RepID=J3K758_COCIM|nr:DNA repair protein Swi5/Sae3 [Coccidioides immitis RS]EFW16444.1 conserved hypothetical protein [Coccidioides posadasii str. Silveira]KMM66973.1 hypothetical protein CPAG_03309 [Coccidioides posadasii RMSCC 3488]KMP03036.1 hypothetical protein CIRG_02728 [Coccidioides immitis RMSCC 2394]KMU76132.1 hypothetical protein CISG_05500 [Coccidioides immitis RMSCC 3703]KMU90649.1 hypothetical protein CIHG_08460 [Coccidioides immitis H538.4]TPX23437.1 hypothetical protein DIZ76_012769 [Coccidioides